MAQRSVSFLKRIADYIIIWGLKIIASSTFVYLTTFWKPIPRPTLIKSYDCRPTLTHRIFFPKSYNSSSSNVPLILDIHSGGFCIGCPQIDDEFCSQLANAANALVVSVDYRMAPLNLFPVPVEDVAVVAHAVIHDPALPVDRDRVCMIGFSSGGNLCLTAAQSPKLRPFIKASIPIYPVLDFVPSSKEKQSALDRAMGQKTYDVAAEGIDILLWGYLPETANLNLKDPLLSPIYAPREVLPAWIYFIGAQVDGLCDEAERMADKVGRIEETQKNIERVAIEGVQDIEGWSCGKIRYEKAVGWGHGFTHILLSGGSAAREAERLKVAQALVERIAKWLRDGPFTC